MMNLEWRISKLEVYNQEEPATPDRPMEDLLIPVKSVGVRKRETAAPAEGNCGRIKVVGYMHCEPVL